MEQNFKLGIRRVLFNKNLKKAILDKEVTAEFIYKKIKINPTSLSQIINFKRCPTEEQKVKLAVLLSISLEEIFPEKYDELYEKLSPLKREVELELDLLRLDNEEVLSLEAPDDMEMNLNNKIEIDSLLSVLPPKELDLIKFRYGIENGETKTLEEVGKEFGVSRERVRQIEAKAFERMRQFNNNKKIHETK